MIDNATIARIWRGRTRRDLQPSTSPIYVAKAFRRFRRRHLACSCFAKIVKKKQSS